MKFAGTVFTIATGLLLSACTTTELVPMTGEEVKAEMVGQTFRYRGFQDNSFTVSGGMDINEDGTLEFRTDTNGPEAGVWRVIDDTVCITLEVLNAGEENCMTVSRSGPGSYETSAGYSLTKV